MTQAVQPGGKGRPSVGSPRPRRLLLLFYTTTFRENFRSLREGRTSDIHYNFIDDTLRNLLELKDRFDDCVVLSCVTPERHDESPYPGLRLIGAKINPYQDQKQLVSMVDEIDPSHLIIRSPLNPVLAWAVKKKVRTLACFASSFEQGGIRQRLERFRLGRMLNSPVVEWVSNHGVNASRALERLGVDREKIVPHDYPHVWLPELPPKTLREGAGPHRVLFVGGVFEDKGVGDAIRSVRILTDEGCRIELEIAGWGDTTEFSRLATSLRIDHLVNFAGSVANSEVVPRMHAADIVLIPSRRAYPEGLPLTIFEALRSRTPIVASDHPMFRGHLEDGSGALVFPSGDCKALAAAIKRLLRDPDLYRTLSTNSKQVWQDMQIPSKVSTLLSAWVDDSEAGRRWLHEHRLASGLYRLPAR